MGQSITRRAINAGLLAIFVAVAITSSCSTDAAVQPFPVHTDPETGIEYVSVDRFSDEAGTVMRRSVNSNLPAPNEPIDFDADFTSHALGPQGEDVTYYAFDVASLQSAPVYSLVFASDPTRRVDGQAPIFDAIPGDAGYNDFWQMIRVLVPDDYEPNSIKSFSDINSAGYPQQRAGMIINCPIVPYGSTAELADRTSTGWYKGKHVKYFSFETTDTGVLNPGQLDVPYAIVRVIFEDNDPSKGMKIDPVTGNTRNVFDTLPGDDLYRALWRHDFVDAADFDTVHDWKSSRAAGTADIDMDNILVNCPIVSWPGS
ncbi:MAG: hypothetical protein O3B95_10680 [Chloroflexi bacterium]|nr:hypothetical protein [Chloroflexota bacterium]